MVQDRRAQHRLKTATDIFLFLTLTIGNIYIQGLESSSMKKSEIVKSEIVQRLFCLQSKSIIKIMGNEL